MSERAEMIDEFAGTMECCRVCLCGNENKAVKDMADEIVRLRSQLAAAESIAQAREALIAALRADKDEARSMLTTAKRERDEARRERDALEMSLAKKAESYRASVLAAEAETKQWKEFFYGQCDKAERMARVVEAVRDYFNDAPNDNGLYSAWTAYTLATSNVRALDAAEGTP